MSRCPAIRLCTRQLLALFWWWDEIHVIAYAHFEIDSHADRLSLVGFSYRRAVNFHAGDLLVEFVVGKTLDEIKALGKEDILEMLGIELGPVRLKCALLSLKVLKAGVYGIEELEEELV